MNEVPCKSDPRAPHGFLRNASHNEDRYVCECENWEPPELHYREVIREWASSESGWYPSYDQCDKLLLLLGIK